MISSILYVLGLILFCGLMMFGMIKHFDYQNAKKKASFDKFARAVFGDSWDDRL